MFVKSILTSTEGLILVYITLYNPPCFGGLSCGQTCLAKIVVFKISHLYRMCVGKAAVDLPIWETAAPSSKKYLFYKVACYLCKSAQWNSLGRVKYTAALQSRKLRLLLLELRLWVLCYTGLSKMKLEIKTAFLFMQFNVYHTTLSSNRKSKVHHFLCNYRTSDNPNCSVTPHGPDWGSHKNAGDFGAVLYHDEDHVRSAQTFSQNLYLFIIIHPCDVFRLLSCLVLCNWD